MVEGLITRDYIGREAAETRAEQKKKNTPSQSSCTVLKEEFERGGWKMIRDVLAPKHICMYTCV